MQKPPVVIIGAGPAGLMAAQEYAKKGYEVHIYEHNKAAGRKFLVAGHGGFNLTHNEDLANFQSRYDRSELYDIIKQFDNKKTVSWLKSIGIETYVGSSGKVFPVKETKPIHVLNAWLTYLLDLGVQIHYVHKFIDFDDQQVKIEFHKEIRTIKFHKLILALGGGSWTKTGSTAQWVTLLQSKGIQVNALTPANSGYNTQFDFSPIEGQVLKNIQVSYQEIHKKGEVVFTTYGMEGSPVYYLNRFTRKQGFPCTINLDLKPNLQQDKIQELLLSKKKVSDILRDEIKLSKTASYLLKRLDKNTFNTPLLLASAIKKYSITVTGFRPIDEVISTAGGICFTELNSDLTLKKYPTVSCIGEMLDWEAPTGGYLLQACFSMGYYCAQHDAPLTST